MADDTNRNPEDVNNVPIIYHDPFDAVRADLGAENIFISNNGILMAHYRVFPCVIGQKDFDGVRRSFDHAYENQGCPLNCENGLAYELAGYVYGIFVQNSKNLSKQFPGGWTNNGQAVITLNRHYKGEPNKPCYVSEYDKLVPCECPEDFFAENWHKVQHSPTGNDRLQFPAFKVQILVDSDGKKYTQDVDFTIQDGQVAWGQNRPGSDQQGRPKIYSIRYTYRPYYYVKTVIHEQRLKAEIDPYTQEVKMKGGPTQCVLEQAHIFLNNRFNDKQKDSQPQSGTGGNEGPSDGIRG